MEEQPLLHSDDNQRKRRLQAQHFIIFSLCLTGALLLVIFSLASSDAPSIQAMEQLPFGEDAAKRDLPPRPTYTVNPRKTAETGTKEVLTTLLRQLTDYKEMVERESRHLVKSMDSESSSSDPTTDKDMDMLSETRAYNEECLHRFRVRLQQTHGLLNFSSGVLPAEKIVAYECPYKGPFSLIAPRVGVDNNVTDCATMETDTIRHTGFETLFLQNRMGAARDLDVYSVALKPHGSVTSLLDPQEIEKLGPFIEYIAQSRLAAHKGVIEVLRCPRVHRLFSALHNILIFSPSKKELQDYNADDAMKPMAEVAATRLWLHYNDVLKRGGSVANASVAGVKCDGDDYHCSAAAVHEIRKRLKDIAYYLEMFGSTLEDDRVGAMGDNIEELLKTLGNFQDARVQGHYIRRFLIATEQPPALGRANREAVHALLVKLEDAETAARNKFAELFLEFASYNTQVLWRDITKIR